MREQIFILCYLKNKFKDRTTKAYSVLVWISDCYCFLSGSLIGVGKLTCYFTKRKTDKPFGKKMHSHKI